MPGFTAGGAGTGTDANTGELRMVGVMKPCWSVLYDVVPSGVVTTIVWGSRGFSETSIW